jgi:hypothetical protein
MSSTPIRIGVIGLGKIAQDQHLPVIAANPDFELVAVSSPRGLAAPGVAHAVRDHAALLAIPEVEAVAICTPPQVRHGIARDALAAGKHVMLEKPPAASISELADLVRLADAAGRVLMTTWHSQHNAAVDEAKRLLAGRTVARLFVNWKEDVRKWHPGQAWIFEAGGFGVFDPGINALSIVTKIMPTPVFLREAVLEFPSSAEAPIAAALRFDGRDGGRAAARVSRHIRPLRRIGPGRHEPGRRCPIPPDRGRLPAGKASRGRGVRSLDGDQPPLAPVDPPVLPADGALLPVPPAPTPVVPLAAGAPMPAVLAVWPQAANDARIAPARIIRFAFTSLSVSLRGVHARRRRPFPPAGRRMRNTS